MFMLGHTENVTCELNPLLKVSKVEYDVCVYVLVQCKYEED